MRRLLQIAMASLAITGACSPTTMDGNEKQPIAQTTQPSTVPSSPAIATTRKACVSCSGVVPTAIIPHRTGPAAPPESIVTSEEAKLWQRRVAAEKAAIDKWLVDDAAALQVKRHLLEEQQQHWQRESEAAAAKLDAESRSRLERVTKDVAEAIGAHKKALVDLQATSTESTKESAAVTKLKLEESLKKARLDLEEQEKQLKDLPKNIIGGLLDLTALVAIP